MLNSDRRSIVTAGSGYNINLKMLLTLQNFEIHQYPNGTIVVVLNFISVITVADLNFLNFVQFLGNFAKIIFWLPH